MPFKSKAQQRWMYANEPGMAKRWSDHTSDHKSLPEKAKKKKKKREKKAALVALQKLAAVDPISPLLASIAARGDDSQRTVLQEFGSPESNRAAWGGFGLHMLGRGLYGRASGLHALRPVSGISRTVPTADPHLKNVLEAYREGGFGGAGAKMPGLQYDSRAYYRPSKHVIGMQRGGHASTLAHELGHATNRKFLLSKLSRLLRRGGAGVSLGGELGVLGTDDPTRAKGYAALSSVGALPVLVEEGRASYKGSQILKNVAKRQGTWDKLKNIGKLKKVMGSWRGVPTYGMAMLGVPWLSYAIKKSLGGYGKKK
jgi:hypothetical protein